MRYRRTAFMMFILGIILIGASVFFGKGKIGLFLLIPVFYGTDVFAFLGFLCIVASMFLIFYSMTQTLGAEEEYAIPVKQERKIKGGGVVFIGPIPIVFGSDMKTAIIMLILGIAFLTGMFLFLMF
ncbi:MAG: DUF131 domain-containing protein [Thermoplasmatales archaeon]|nr:DUF131 domain-containing protein [Thermoplasmatales archaeon]